jgi:Na+/proline symporter
MVQRLLAAPTERQSRAALFASWVVILIQFTLFLIIGVCLFVLYSDNHWKLPDVQDKIYPLFIWQHLPVGISGLVMAAILAAAMSNLSAALNSLASTTVMDFLKPLYAGRSGEASERVWLMWARYATVAWGAILFGVALIARHWGSVLQAGLSIASIIYGSLLGVFLLGLLTKRVGELAAMCAMACGLVLMLYIRFFTPIAWTWYVLIGSSATFAIGVAASFLFREKTPVTETA